MFSPRLKVRALLLTLVPLAAFAYQSQSPPADDEIVLGPEPKEMFLDFVVRSKDGRLIRDLKPEEVHIVDGVFPLLLKGIEAVTPPKGRVFKDEDHRFITLVFDTVIPEQSDIAAKIAREILRSSSNGVEVSVLCLTSQWNLIHPFTRDQKSIESAISTLYLRAGGHRGTKELADKAELSTQESAIDDLGARALSNLISQGARVIHEPGTLVRLFQIVRAQSGLPGRKVVLWLGSRSVPVDRDLELLISEANLSNVSFYILDTAALHRIDRVMANSEGQDEAQRSLDKYMDSEQERMRGLFTVALNTGGFFIFHRRDYLKRIRAIAEELESHYVARYIPSPREPAGVFRTTAVEVKRANVVVQYRAGYHDSAADRKRTSSEHESRMLDSPAAQNVPGDLEYGIGVFGFRPRPARPAATVIFDIPLQHLSTRKAAVLAAFRDAAGNVIARVSRDVEIGEPEGKHRLIISETVAVPPGRYTVETVVLDPFRNRMGRRTVAFTQPDPGAGPEISEIALVKGLREDDQWAPRSFFNFENALAVPNLSRVVIQGQPFYIFFILYPAEARELTLEIQLVRNGRPETTFPVRLANQLGSEPIAQMTSISSSALPPGQYELRAITKHGGDSRMRILEFVIQGASGAPMLPEPTLRTEVSSVGLPPAIDVQKDILGRAVLYAGKYTAALPNFSCVQKTERYVDPSGYGKWQKLDVMSEEVRFRMGREEYYVISADGKKQSARPAKVRGITSTGEFGSLLRDVFSPASDAKFAWRSWGVVGEVQVQVFSYEVARENSTYTLSHSGRATQRVTPGFHGLLYIEPDTGRVRRVTLTVNENELPPDFPIRACTLKTDYADRLIGDSKFLMPVSAVVELRKTPDRSTRNEITFTKYRLYTAASNILYEPKQ